jgi:hypothetical protein
VGESKQILKNFRDITRAKTAAAKAKTNEGVREAQKEEVRAREKAWNALAERKPEIKDSIKEWKSARAIIDSDKSTTAQRWEAWPRVRKAENKIRQAVEDIENELKARKGSKAKA